MIMVDNPLTAVHATKDVEIVDCNALILDLKENTKHEAVKFVYCDVNLHTLILIL